MENRVFYCDRCGICCTRLNLSEIYMELDNGTGTCRYFDTSTKLCLIYENRPEKCNIIAVYGYFKKVMTFEQYIRMNEESCKKLKEL